MADKNLNNRSDRLWKEAKSPAEPEEYLKLIDGEILSDPEQFDVADENARLYLASNAGGHLKWSSVPTYESTLGMYVDFLHNQRNKQVIEADIYDVAAYTYQCADLKENRISTIDTNLGIVKMLHEFLEKEYGTDVSVTSGQIGALNIDRLESMVPESIQREALSKEEVRLLFDLELPRRNKLMMKGTGIRNKDTRLLKSSNIDYDNLTLTVEYSKGGKTYTVPITPKLALELEDYEETVRKARDPNNMNDYLFPSNQGGHLKTNGSYSRIVRNAAKAAGIQQVLGQIHFLNHPSGKKYINFYRVTPHTLRHSILTHLKNEVSDEHRRDFAGHANVETTNEYYTHIGESDRLSEIRDALLKLI